VNQLVRTGACPFAQARRVRLRHGRAARDRRRRDRRSET
jgi:hypothetical protein